MTGILLPTSKPGAPAAPAAPAPGAEVTPAVATPAPVEVDRLEAAAPGTVRRAPGAAVVSPAAPAPGPQAPVRPRAGTPSAGPRVPVASSTSPDLAGMRRAAEAAGATASGGVARPGQDYTVLPGESPYEVALTAYAAQIAAAPSEQEATALAQRLTLGMLRANRGRPAGGDALTLHLPTVDEALRLGAAPDGDERGVWVRAFLQRASINAQRDARAVLAGPAWEAAARGSALARADAGWDPSWWGAALRSPGSADDGLAVVEPAADDAGATPLAAARPDPAAGRPGAALEAAQTRRRQVLADQRRSDLRVAAVEGAAQQELDELAERSRAARADEARADPQSPRPGRR